MRLLRQILVSAVGLGFFFVAGNARGYESVTFVTRQDRFTVKKTGRGAFVDGKKVLNDLLKLIHPLLAGVVGDDCPALKGRAPISASILTGDKLERREFFVGRNVVRSGGRCLFVEGDGMFYLPEHRSWLIGPFRDSIDLRSPLKVMAGSTVLASLVKNADGWSDTAPQTQLDWDFVQKFESSLADYQVSYRVAVEAGKDKPTVTLQSGSEKYTFYKLSPELWAVQRPGRKWLDASSDWEFWYDMDASIWQDRRIPLIQQAENPSTKPEDKINIFDQLETGWSRALEQFYQRRMLDPKEDPEIRKRSMARLRSKPSWHNMAAFMKLVQSNPSDDLLREATSALRVRNSKGTAFEAGESDRNAVIAEWNSWWKENSHRND